MHFDRAPVPCPRDKPPFGRRAGAKGDKVSLVERRNESVGHEPHAHALGKHMTIHRDQRVKIGRKRAIVFRVDPTQIHSQSCHPTAAVRKENRRSSL